MDSAVTIRLQIVEQVLPTDRQTDRSACFYRTLR